MRYTILIKRDENTKNIEAQEQARFIKTILEALEVGIDYKSEEPLSIEEKIKMRKSLGFYGITIMNIPDGSLKIYVEKELIAEWKKPLYKIKKDPSQIDPNKKLYMEMSIDFWTVFEQDNRKE
jgi:hypothetical protein